MAAEHEMRITRTCAQLPQLRQLELWCTLVGHWTTREHVVRQRTLKESVLLYCIDGDGWFTLDGQRYTISTGSIFCCQEGHEHSYGCGANGWEIHWIHLGGQFARTLLTAAGFDITSPVRHLGQHKPLLQAFQRLEACLEATTPNTAWDASGHLYWLLLTLIRPNPTRSLLADTLPEDYTCLEDLATAAGYSKFHYCRLFKQQTGRSPWQYITERKLERGCELLLNTRLSVKEIAFRLGFNTPDYFARLFARYIGVKPSEYRGNRR